VTRQTISRYRILEKISGGIGIVCKAGQDPLVRSMALKFLLNHVANHRPTLRCFERVAQGASALNHLNLCIIDKIDDQLRIGG
jgi:eukaryotic-like serine/threonine-protein kinase